MRTVCIANVIMLSVNGSMVPSGQCGMLSAPLRLDLPLGTVSTNTRIIDLAKVII
jgi:hypothetical protein